MSYEHLIRGYEVEVEFPDVSGAEHLLMLMRRREIAKIEFELTAEQHQRLALADKQLLQQASEFWVELSQFVNLGKERRSRNIYFSHWWRYLDVIAQLRINFNAPVQPIPQASSQPKVETNMFV